MIKRSCAIAALIAACLLAVFAQTTPNKGRQVVDSAVASLGGEKFLHLQNRVASGRLYGFFHDELSHLELVKQIVEYVPDAPSGDVRVRERQLLGKKQDYSYLYLPDKAFDVTFRGARPISDEQWQQYVRSTNNNVLYMLRARLNEPGLQFDYVASDVYLSRHVDIVDITDATDQVVRVYFDFNTKLPVHETYSWFDPAMKVHNDDAIEFDKYRDAGGGVMWPFSIERQHNGYKVYELFADKVEVNQSLPAGIFELPAGAKVLRKSN